MVTVGAVSAADDGAMAGATVTATAAHAEADQLTARGLAVIDSGAATPDGATLKAARADLERAAELWRELGEAGLQGRCLHGVALASALLDDWQRAGSAATEAAAIADRLGDDELACKALGELAGIRLEQGRNLEAEALFIRVAALASALGDVNQQHTMLHNLASSYAVRQSYQEALDTHEQALALARQHGLGDKELSSLIAIAAIHRTLGDTAPAQRRLAEAVALAEERGDRRRAAWALRELGHAQVEEGQYNEARESYERSLEIRRDIGDARGVGIVINQLATLEGKLGRTDRAIELYREANATARELGDPVGVAVTLTNLARSQLAAGDANAAHDNLTEALSIYRELGLMRNQVGTLGTLARVSLALDRPAQARNEAVTALDLLEAIRSELADPDLRARYLAPRREVAVTLVEALLELADEEPDGGHLEAAFIASEQVHARTLLELVKGAASAGGETDRELDRKRSSVNAELSAVQGELLSRSVDDHRRNELEARRLELDDRRRALESELRRRHIASDAASLDLAALQARLGADTALVEYLVGERASIAFVVTDRGVTARRLPAASELRAVVEPFRELLGRPGRRDRERLRIASVEAGRMVLGPVLASLTDRRRLIVVPDGILHLIPFEALRVGDDHRLLLEERQLSYAPSAALLEPLAARHRSRHDARTLFAVADPTVSADRLPITVADHRQLADGRSIDDLGSLPEARAEVEAVAATFAPGAAVVLVGEAAQEATVRSHPALPTATNLHFATHAVASTDLPEHSGLVLGAAGSEDGLLQAFEIFDLSLDAELVVLSGCETALGPELSGEGLLGLTRAFFYAGAEQVVISLWPVEDRSTRELMTTFYRRLRSTTPADALREAKLELAATPGFEHPFYWAPFVIVGGYEEPAAPAPDPSVYGEGGH